MQRLLLAVLSLLLGSPPAEAAPAGGQWTLDDVLGLPERLSITGDFRLRYEYLDEQFRSGLHGENEVLPLRTRVRARLRITNWLTVGAELQDSRSYLANDNTPVGTGLVNAAELLRAYVELSAEGPFGGRHVAQLGRLTMDFGNRRLIARNAFRNTSNAFTGMDWRWRFTTKRELRVFYVLPVKRLPDERDRLVNNEIEFDSDSFDYQFWGLNFSDELPWGDSGELYFFGLHEKKLYDDTDVKTLARRRIFTPGFRLLRAPQKGRFDYELETALQWGKGRSQSSLRDIEGFAHLHYLGLGYTFDRPGSPRLILHYAYASGDKDPSDDSWQRFDPLFGGRRFEFAPTSIFGPWSRSNINTPGVRLQLRPAAQWTVFVDYRAVWLASRRDEWVGSGIQDLSGQSGSYVGSQIEMRVQWDVLPQNLRLEFGYAHLFAGRFIREANPSSQGDSNYVYALAMIWF